METRNEKTFTESYTSKNGTFIVTIKVWQELKFGQSFKNTWLWEQSQTVTCPDGAVIELSSNLGSWELNEKYSLPMNAPVRIPVTNIRKAVAAYQEQISRGTVEQQKERGEWERIEKMREDIDNA